MLSDGCCFLGAQASLEPGLGSKGPPSLHQACLFIHPFGSRFHELRFWCWFNWVWVFLHVHLAFCAMVRGSISTHPSGRSEPQQGELLLMARARCHVHSVLMSSWAISIPALHSSNPALAHCRKQTMRSHCPLLSQ